MITKENIEHLYQSYPGRAGSIDCLNLALLFDTAARVHKISVDAQSEELIVESIPPGDLFHRIHLRNIHAIERLEDWIALVFHSSILFLHSHTPTARTHLRAMHNAQLNV